MADSEIRELFSKNLRYWMSRRGVNQTDLRKIMGVSSATASDWFNGRKIPRTDKINIMCAWLGIDISDLLADKDDRDRDERIVFDPVTEYIAQSIFENPYLGQLFEITKDLSTDDVSLLIEMAKRFKPVTSDSPQLLAAHERTDVEVTEEGKRHDLDLMKNWRG